MRFSISIHAFVTFICTIWYDQSGFSSIFWCIWITGCHPPSNPYCRLLIHNRNTLIIDDYCTYQFHSLLFLHLYFLSLLFWPTSIFIFSTTRNVFFYHSNSTFNQIHRAPLTMRTFIISISPCLKMCVKRSPFSLLASVGTTTRTSLSVLEKSIAPSSFTWPS